MRLLLTIAIVLFIATCDAKGQTREHFSVINTIDRGDYFYIPKNALTGPFHGIVYQDKTLKKSTSNKQPIELYWHSTCNDGSYILTITPEQIFFSSGHDNPNPNELFWVIEINAANYGAIKQGLAHDIQKGFQNLSKYYHGSKIVYLDNFKDSFSIPDTWTDAQLLKHENYCQLQIQNQVKKYFSIINSYSLATKSRIATPKTNCSKGRLFSYSKAEIGDHLPMLVPR